MESSAPTGWVTRMVRLLATMAAVIAVVIIVTSGGGRSHSIYVTVPDATDVIPGQQVRAAGAAVGSVAAAVPVDGGRAARLQLAIDDSAWATPQRWLASTAIRMSGPTTSLARASRRTSSSTSAPTLSLICVKPSATACRTSGT